ncbi:MAG: DUF92 domain-containing protein [Flavobacteriales bacterium]
MHFAVALPEFLLAIVLAVVFALATVRSLMLTKGGAAMAAAIGLAVIAGQGWLWLLPLLLFLGSGVLLGRLNKNARTDAKHGKPRDAMQVFCSGGVYAYVALLSPGNAHEPLMSVSICVANADTWASEIGMWARWRTWNILTLRKVEPGLSGGISLPGLVGGVAGAVFMGTVCGMLMSGMSEGAHYFGVMMVLALPGIAGMLLDSLLGATLQAKYDDGEGRSDAGLVQVGGVQWMTNDVVNVLSNVAIVAIVAWIMAHWAG